MSYNNNRRYEPRYPVSSSSSAPVGRYPSSVPLRGRDDSARDGAARDNSYSSSSSAAGSSTARRTPRLSRDFDQVGHNILRAIGSFDLQHEAAVLMTAKRMDIQDQVQPEELRAQGFDIDNMSAEERVMTLASMQSQQHHGGYQQQQQHQGGYEQQQQQHVGFHQQQQAGGGTLSMLVDRIIIPNRLAAFISNMREHQPDAHCLCHLFP
jgi:hypothetical protein